MTIKELLAATGLTENDLVPIWDAEAAQSVEPTQKITAAQLAAAVKALASLVNTTEMNAAIQQSTASTKIGIVTMATGTSQIFVRQYGNVVCIGGWVSNATLTANASTKIADITGISYPPDSVRAYCNVGSNAYSVGTLSYITVSTDGELYVASSNGGTGKAIYFDICYVANN